MRIAQGIVLVFVAIVACLPVVMWFAMTIMAGVRAYVEQEVDGTIGIASTFGTH
jgi:hypothetical protein